MSKVTKVIAREILDSRGNPTVEVDILLDHNSFGRASVPSGASTGSHEAIELRDNDQSRYGGKGVTKAVSNINGEIASKIIGSDFDQKKIDQTLIDIDGTKNKNRLGANAILGVSMAFARASAFKHKIALYEYFNKLSDNAKITMPLPLMNILNGGKHAENSSDIQEFMIVPRGWKTFKEHLRVGAEIFHTLKKILSTKKLNTTVGDEGGFAPSLDSNESALELILEAIDQSGYRAGDQVAIALDVAATELYKNNKYVLARDKKELNDDEMIAWYESLINKYPIISIEDGLAEDDWHGYRKFTDKLGHKIQIVGDDLFATNIERLGAGIEKNIANSILIKLNQIGTVSETISVIDLARKAKYSSIISHRSGETEDTTIADLAVGVGSGQIKTGSLSRTDRIAKYNQLLRIEESIIGEK